MILAALPMCRLLVLSYRGVGGIQYCNNSIHHFNRQTEISSTARTSKGGARCYVSGIRTYLPIMSETLAYNRQLLIVLYGGAPRFDDN